MKRSYLSYFPSSFPPSGRPRAQASARRSPPAAALALAPALRSRPGRQRRLGGPGAPRRERPGCAAGPSALGPTSRPLRPRWGSPQAVSLRAGPNSTPTLRWAWAPRLGRAPGHSGGSLATTLPPQGAPLPGAASALGPRIQHWPQGQRPLLSPGRCQVPPPGSPRSPRRPSPCSSPELHQSPLHSACLSTGAGDSNAGPSAPQPPPHRHPRQVPRAEWRPTHSTGPRSRRQTHVGRTGGFGASIR